MLRRFSKWLVRFFAFTGFMTFLSSFALMMFALSQKPKEPEMPAEAILHLDLGQPLRSMPATDPFSALLEPEATDLFTLTESIRRAATDKRVKGLVADLSFAQLDLASTQELHEALDTFRKSGKFTIGFADTFGEGGNATGQYFLASGFEKLWMQPSGTLDLIGLGAEMPFFKDTLTWAGIQPDFLKAGDYKTAMNTFTESGFTPAHRTQIQQLLAGMYDEINRGITAHRKLSAPLKTLFDNAPYLAADAKKAGLIDTLGYWDEVEKTAEKSLSKDADKDKAWISTTAYSHILKKEHLKILKGEKSKQKKIAVVYLHGAIMREGGNASPLTGGEPPIVASELASDISEAVKDDSIGALVVRIDSPGGSYTASDTIYRALMQAKAAKKPVIVSMAGTAASGGYFIAMAGDKVIANPATITGSIGVFGGKMVIKELSTKLKVHTDSVQIGQNALMWSAMTPFNGAGKAAFERAISFVDKDFQAHVAKARKLSPEVVSGLAGGRVYTGTQALAVKLIDQTGSLRTAMNIAKKDLGYAPDALAPVVVYPQADNPMQVLRVLLSGGSIEGRIHLLWQAIMGQMNWVRAEMGGIVLSY